MVRAAQPCQELIADGAGESPAARNATPTPALTSYDQLVADIGFIPLDAFANALRVGMFTDEEIAEWIKANQLSAKDKITLTRATADLKSGPITGVIRTALREKEGLRPVPGDDSYFDLKKGSPGDPGPGPSAR
jgi:hypothetical protein